jgi:hypothetical protein
MGLEPIIFVYHDEWFLHFSPLLDITLTTQEHPRSDPSPK